MSWIKLTRMVERKTKDGARGELRTFAFAGVSPIWMRTGQVAAVSTFRGHVYTDDWDTIERDITEIRMAGIPEPVFVSEPVAAVLVGLDIPEALHPEGDQDD